MMTTVSDVTIRCLLELMDYRAVRVDISKRQDHDLFVIRKGLLPLMYHVPKAESDYIIRAWSGEMDAVIGEILNMTWDYGATCSPKSLYTMAFVSYMSRPGINQLKIIGRLVHSGINDWNREREVQILENCGHPEVVLFI